jgi:hypothetical protein
VHLFMEAHGHGAPAKETVARVAGD